VVAVSTNTGTADALNGDPTVDAGDYVAFCPIDGSPGQANRITRTTGGSHTVGVDPASIVPILTSLIRAAVLSINVRLQPTGAIAAFVTSISPASYGPLPGDVAHELPF